MRRTSYITLLLCCVAALFLSCRHNSLGESAIQPHNRIDSILTGIDTATSETLVTELLFYDEIADSIRTEEKPYFLYIVNADCSNCIANFFRFIDQVNNSDSSLKTVAVVNTLYNKNLSFYSKRAGCQSFFQTISVSDDCWNDKVMTDYYELYLIKGTSIVKRFLTCP